MHGQWLKLIGAAALIVGIQSCCFGIEFPGPPPGIANGSLKRSEAVLENNSLAMHWNISGGHLRPSVFANKLSAGNLDFSSGEIFELVLGDTPMPTKRTLKASQCRLVGSPEIVRLPGSPSATRISERAPGQQFLVRLEPSSGGFQIEWKASLRNGSNYIRQELSIRAGSEPVEVVEIVLFDAPVPGVEMLGTVDGSPAVAGQTFFGYEHPLAKLTASNGVLRGVYPVGDVLFPGESVRNGSVIGVYPAKQQRRGFLYYLERERAHPYRAFVNHNNGEDVGALYYGMKRKDPQGAAQFRANQTNWWNSLIETVGQELVEKRGARIDSFMHDWEWDDETLVWQFHNGFPDGFTPLRKTAERFGSALGIWLAPHGEYGIKAGIEQGWSTISDGLSPKAPGLAFADHRYYGRVRQAMVGMLTRYGVNYYKFDGVSNTRTNLEALIKLMRELRFLNPNVFILASSGTWPSPFWLLDTDAIWRGGSDTGLIENGPSGKPQITLDSVRLQSLGIGPRPGGALAKVISKGSQRQQWLTYRDYEVYNSVLGRGPLYPISSLMVHGIVINHGGRVKTFEEVDEISEIRSYFATGTNLQELYISADLMTPRTWNVLAEAARWARANSEVLADTHWVGGDPSNYEVYGWASWSNGKGIIGLRNPNDQPGKFTLDVAHVFELPAGAPTSYFLKSPWAEDSAKPAIRASAGEPVTIDLAPLQVVVLDASTVK